jgi:hypothetical protein
VREEDTEAGDFEQGLQADSKSSAIKQRFVRRLENLRKSSKHQTMRLHTNPGSSNANSRHKHLLGEVRKGILAARLNIDTLLVI